LISLLGGYIDLNLSIKRIYIPMLRGLRPIQLQDNDFANTIDNYLLRCMKDYFEDSPVDREYIFTGLGLYENTKKLLLGNTENRNKIRAFERFLSECFFDGKDINIVPSIADDV